MPNLFHRRGKYSDPLSDILFETRSEKWSEYFLKPVVYFAWIWPNLRKSCRIGVHFYSRYVSTSAYLPYRISSHISELEGEDLYIFVECCITRFIENTLERWKQHFSLEIWRKLISFLISWIDLDEPLSISSILSVNFFLQEAWVGNIFGQPCRIICF